MDYTKELTQFGYTNEVNDACIKKYGSLAALWSNFHRFVLDNSEELPKSFQDKLKYYMFHIEGFAYEAFPGKQIVSWVGDKSYRILELQTSCLEDGHIKWAAKVVNGVGKGTETEIFEFEFIDKKFSDEPKITTHLLWNMGYSHHQVQNIISVFPMTVLEEECLRDWGELVNKEAVKQFLLDKYGILPAFDRKQLNKQDSRFCDMILTDTERDVIIRALMQYSSSIARGIAQELQRCK